MDMSISLGFHHGIPVNGDTVVASCFLNGCMQRSILGQTFKARVLSLVKMGSAEEHMAVALNELGAKIYNNMPADLKDLGSQTTDQILSTKFNKDGNQIFASVHMFANIFMTGEGVNSIW